MEGLAVNLSAKLTPEQQKRADELSRNVQESKAKGEVS
jgi:hypothetical protein